MKRRTITGLMVLLLCVSCSSAKPASTSPGHAGGRLAFEQFPEYKVNLLNYTQVKLTATCMQKDGYPQLAKAGMPEPDKNQNYMRVTAARFGPPDVAHARKYGFGYEWNTPAAPPSIVSFDAAYDKTLERCQDSAWKQIGSDAKRFYTAINEFSNKLMIEYSQQLRSRPEWNSLNQALLECLADAGYRPATQANGGGSPGKPPRPDSSAAAGLPSVRSFGIELGLAESTAERWRPEYRKGTVQVGPAVPARHYTPTLDEIKFAVTYANCNQATGRTKQLLAISQQLQDSVMRKHETEFTELNATLDKLVSHAATLVGRS